MNEGWKCPECHTIYAPFVRECKCSKRKTEVYAIPVKTKEHLESIDVALHPKDMIIAVEDEAKYYKLNTNGFWTEYHPGKNIVLLKI